MVCQVYDRKFCLCIYIVARIFVLLNLKNIGKLSIKKAYILLLLQISQKACEFLPWILDSNQLSFDIFFQKINLFYRLRILNDKISLKSNFNSNPQTSCIEPVNEFGFIWIEFKWVEN